MATNQSKCPFISLPPKFRFSEVDGKYPDVISSRPLETSNPLGVLNSFNGSFIGSGFNAIFRPNNSVTPTTFHNKIEPVKGTEGHSTDNVLELNVTKEALTFIQQNIGQVPNRGEGPQGDIFLAGVSYVQVVSDMLNPLTYRADSPDPQVIHYEPGLWMQVPASQFPLAVPASLIRMGSIPHGTTINATGVSPQGPPTPGAPMFKPASLIPNAELGGLIKEFQNFSLDVANANSPRIPQDLSRYNETNTITQAMLDNPLTVLENANSGKNIIENSSFSVSATLATGGGGSGIVNISFLQGNVASQNANVTTIDNTFWVETVQYDINVPVTKAGETRHVTPPKPNPASPVPSFLVTPPVDITAPRILSVTSTQIQFYQNVSLRFNSVGWPHISVGTLVPEAPILVPSSAF